ncbi:MAG TPA: hypothetical protein VMQ76_06005 [Terracidiphilus sp.]|nr:hypothetical protein [Terracidiphilus sp.]
MITDAPTLLAQSGCYRSFGITSTAQLLKLGLLAQIALALNPMADVSPEALLKLAACYKSYSNASLGDLLEIALLALIAQSVS